MAAINQQVHDVQQKMAQIDGKLVDLRAHQQQLHAQQQQQAELIAEHISASYRLSGQDFFKQLLNQESPDKLERLIRYHRYFSESRLAVVEQYQTTLEELSVTNAALSEQQIQQTEQQSLLIAQQRSLAGSRSERAKSIDALNTEHESKTEEYARLQKDRQRLEQLLAELRRRATELDGTAFARAKGKLPMPVKGKVLHAFGQRRADGRLRWHGIDIAADQGTPVAAVFRGRVIFADWLRGFGLLTIVDHGSGYMTLYGHADALHKKEGDWVESGEKVATAGNSGGKQASGVYFEVRHQGQPKDPISWVVR